MIRQRSLPKRRRRYCRSIQIHTTEVEAVCMTEPHTNGSLSVVVPMDDFKLILRQMWKSRGTEPKMGELYEKYTNLISFDNESHSQ